MTDPKRFGFLRGVGWKSEAELRNSELDNLAVARLQHLIALRIRLAAERQGLTLLELAEDSGMNYGRLGRMLRGDIVIRFEDMVWADKSLGLDLVAGFTKSLHHG